jgi:hypothetical protein
MLWPQKITANIAQEEGPSLLRTLIAPKIKRGFCTPLNFIYALQLCSKFHEKRSPNNIFFVKSVVPTAIAFRLFRLVATQRGVGRIRIAVVRGALAVRTFHFCKVTRYPNKYQSCYVKTCRKLAADPPDHTEITAAPQ